MSWLLYLISSCSLDIINLKGGIVIRYITYIGRSGLCPHIKETVSLSGKYEISEDRKTASYCSFTCPIEENAKLPYYEQCEQYKYLIPCESKFDCPIAKKFEDTINL